MASGMTNEGGFDSFGQSIYLMSIDNEINDTSELCSDTGDATTKSRIQRAYQLMLEHFQLESESDNDCGTSDMKAYLDKSGRSTNYESLYSTHFRRYFSTD